MNQITVLTMVSRKEKIFIETFTFSNHVITVQITIQE